MKSMVSNKTKQYLKQLEDKERSSVVSEPTSVYTSTAEGRVSVRKIFFDIELGMMLVLFSNKKVATESLKKYPRLAKASLEQLEKYKVSPMGIHWVELDEDLGVQPILDSVN